jgi:hypothetical protein
MKRTLGIMIFLMGNMSFSAYAENPASVSYVNRLIQEVRDQIAATTTALTPLAPNDWQTLCAETPGGISTGCRPTCTGTTATACAKMFNATGVQGLAGVQKTVVDGMYVQSFTPQTTNGPEVNLSGTNYASCGVFDVTGKILYPHVPVMGAGAILLGVLPAISSGSPQPYGSIGLLNGGTYYVICLSYTSTTPTTNISSTNITSITWS